MNLYLLCLVSLVQSDVLRHQKKGGKSMLQQILQNFSFARRLKYEKLLPFLVNRGDLLSSGIAKAFSFYNPLKWALFSRNRSNVGCKEKEKGGAWPLLNSIAVLCVSNFITLHLHTVLKIHFWSTNSFLAKRPKKRLFRVTYFLQYVEFYRYQKLNVKEWIHLLMEDQIPLECCLP